MNRYLLSLNKSACCGCGLCAFRCPASCIHMEEDSEGFHYPIIESDKCIGCDLCAKVCPFENQPKYGRDGSNAYAAHSVNGEILLNSSSGGIFSEIALRFLNTDGYVCSATIDERHQVKHTTIFASKDLSKLQGSKYVQSNLYTGLSELRDVLKSGKRVLFVGTPCQVAAVKNSFKESNLFTIDVLCHGVPSQKLFDHYINYLERKHGGILTDIFFRDKEKNGWSITQKYVIQKKGKKKKYYLDRHLSEYFSGFLRNMTQRESCYVCPFTSIERCGDLTLADFWGIEKVHPEYYNASGTSLVLVNSRKGQELFDEIDDIIVSHNVTLDDAMIQNPNFSQPPKREKERDWIYQDVYKYGFEQIGKKYILPPNAYKYRIAALLRMDVAKLSRRRKK